MQTEIREIQTGQNRPAPPSPKSGMSAATAVLPLRLFLGLTFIAAGIDKLTSKEFLDPNATGYLGNQLTAFATISPIGGLLRDFVAPNAVIFGALILAGEIAIGLGTLVGLFSRTAAAFGMLLSLTLWLSTTWQVQPFYLGSDLPFMIGWIILLLAGAHPVLSLDGQLQQWLARRKVAESVNNFAPVATQVESAEEKAALARRRFIAVTGATVAAGAFTAVAWSNSLPDSNSTVTSGTSATPAPTTAPTSAANSVPAATPTAQATVAQNTAVPATTAPTSNPAPTATAARPNSTATAVPPVNGTVIATLASIPTGDAKTFTTPDTKESAIVIHEADGSVKAFSRICTHQGCEVNFNKSSKALECPCHGAQFDIQTGAATRRPANLPLKSFKVQVDANGNILYIKG